MDIERLHYMANQIARNLASQGEVQAIEGTAKHIHDFWDRRMKAMILEDAESAEPVVKSALRRLLELER